MISGTGQISELAVLAYARSWSKPLCSALARHGHGLFWVMEQSVHIHQEMFGHLTPSTLCLCHLQCHFHLHLQSYCGHLHTSEQEGDSSQRIHRAGTRHSRHTATPPAGQPGTCRPQVAEELGSVTATVSASALGGITAAGLGGSKLPECLCPSLPQPLVCRARSTLLLVSLVLVLTPDVLLPEERATPYSSFFLLPPDSSTPLGADCALTRNRAGDTHV